MVMGRMDRFAFSLCKTSFPVLRRFALTFVTLSGLAGTAIALAKYHYLWVFWLVLGAAVLLTFGRAALLRANDFITRIRRYPAVLLQVGQLNQQLQQLQASLGAAEKAAEASFESGKEEGRRQYRASLLATEDLTPPTISSITMSGDALVLIGDGHETRLPPVGARFVLSVRGTGETLGVLEVSEIKSESVLMFCADVVNVEFWNDLELRAQTNFSPPDGVELSVFRLAEHQPDEQPPQTIIPSPPENS